MEALIDTIVFITLVLINILHKIFYKRIHGESLFSHGWYIAYLRGLPIMVATVIFSVIYIFLKKWALQFIF